MFNVAHGYLAGVCLLTVLLQPPISRSIQCRVSQTIRNRTLHTPNGALQYGRRPRQAFQAVSVLPHSIVQFSLFSSMIIFHLPSPNRKEFFQGQRSCMPQEPSRSGSQNRCCAKIPGILGMALVTGIDGGGRLALSLSVQSSPGSEGATSSIKVY
jgi:hypothetical protein